MSLDIDTLEALRRQHPAWRLLLADSAALEGWRRVALGEHLLSVESCNGREQDMRRWLQERLDADDKKLGRLGEKIVRAMAEYKEAFKLDSQEVDASVAAGPEFRTMLAQLQADDLPRFVARFKELLNENTIRELAHFQSQLHRERETIKERIARINESLTQIDYNPGRFIALESQATPDAEVRDFQTELRACTEGTLTGSDDAQYSEAKFLQVQRIIERFRGRNGSADADRRWAAKVTDVRHWFVFAASGFDALVQAAWLQRCEVHYWGDIDTHGFAILDQLRSHFEHARSFLMDRETLLAHRAQWTAEPQPTQRELSRLGDEERRLYDDLRWRRLCEEPLRLEQERLAFGCVERALAAL